MANETHGDGLTLIASTLSVSSSTTSQIPPSSTENLVTAAATLLIDVSESLTTDKLTSLLVSTATSLATTEQSTITTTTSTTTTTTTVGTTTAAITTTTSPPSTIQHTTTVVTEATTTSITTIPALSEEYTTALPQGEWMKVGVISGIALASLILLVIIVIFCICMLRRRYAYKRQRSMERVENPIYRRQGGDRVLLTMHAPLGDNPSGPLANNNRVKNPELWASKDVAAKPKPAAARKQSMERRPTLRTPAPFAANGDDGLATNDLFEKESHGSMENLNLAQYVVNNKNHDPDFEPRDDHDESKQGHPLLSHDDSDLTDSAAYYSDDPARMSTFTRRR